MHEICQIAFEAHHAACKQSSGSKLGHTPQSKTIRDEEAFFLLKIIGMKEKNTEAYSAKIEPEKRRVRVFPGVRVFPESCRGSFLDDRTRIVRSLIAHY
jgi:hypothetical protein